jgi:hypothetical protein
LVAIYNSLPDVTPVETFKTAKTGAGKIAGLVQDRTPHQLYGLLRQMVELLFVGAALSWLRRSFALPPHQQVEEKKQKVMIPRQSRGLFVVSRSKRLWGVASAVPC